MEDRMIEEELKLEIGAAICGLIFSIIVLVSIVIMFIDASKTYKNRQQYQGIKNCYCIDTVMCKSEL